MAKKSSSTTGDEKPAKKPRKPAVRKKKTSATAPETTTTQLELTAPAPTPELPAPPPVTELPAPAETPAAPRAPQPNEDTRPLFIPKITPVEETPAPSPQPAPAPATPPPAVQQQQPAPQPTPAAPPAPKPDNSIKVSGILDIDQRKGGNGQLLDPARNGHRRPTDTFIPKELIRRFKLRQGSFITGTAFPPEGRFPNPKIRFIDTVDGLSIEDRRNKPEFNSLTTLSPESHLKMELRDGRLTTRAVDLFCPVGKGTRGLIVAPPRTGKTTLLRDMALGVIQNNPETHVMILLVDERPEEVTDFRRSVPAEVWASSNDERTETHIGIAELCIERAKRLVEAGRDVVILLDSLTRLARAYNALKNTGRTGSGGLDVRALEKPRQLFAAARNTEDGGSLTIVASILVETGSRMDDVIFQEFKGTGNMELVLDRKCAEMRLWPAINIASSGTRREELLLDPKELEGIHFFRRALVQQRIEEATETMIARLSKTKTNEEFLKLIAR